MRDNDRCIIGGVLDGGCSCGEIRYRLTSRPLFVHCCHCLNCQRQSGGAFVINLIIERDRVEVVRGEPVVVEVARGDRVPQRIFRCPTCQVAVWSQYGPPHAYFVRGGTLDEPSLVEPDVHIYTRSKVPWLTLPASVPAFDELYDIEELWPPESLARVEAARG